MTAFVRILPEDDPKAPGWRYRLERDDGEASLHTMAVLSNEHVHPERVNDVGALFTEPADCFWLKRREAVWLRDALDALLTDWLEDP